VWTIVPMAPLPLLTFSFSHLPTGMAPELSYRGSISGGRFLILTTVSSTDLSGGSCFVARQTSTAISSCVLHHP